MLGAIRDFFQGPRNEAPPTVSPDEERFLYLREGRYDPELNKRVKKVIIVNASEFAVYVDSHYDVQFLINKEINVTEFGKVQTQVTYLEQASTFLKGEREALLHVRSLLGEAYSQVLSTGKSDAAAEPLALARAVLAQKSQDVSYGWYFQSALMTCVLLAFLGSLLWFSRHKPCVTTYLGETAFELTLCAIAGAIGALFSISSRASHLSLNALAGKRSHELEAHARLFAGMLSASLLVMALKSKLILAPLADGHGHLTTLLLLSALAGISERVIPSLVSRFEESMKRTEKELEERGKAPHSVGAEKSSPAQHATAQDPLKSTVSAEANSGSSGDVGDKEAMENPSAGPN
ncbi:hypothetical protein [Burkholderia sp. SCN-KJ]|uniref:hypothetical protein n=1 Tax=Burkholderia sp. SCN-KJ TaxID=2969248 RepID=UPI002150005B|nr:hypothetical protein [Burkholderia sp. SCN-KJ]MCR4470407.1 hypothetical protein [Burkholderia sp. SCN-KJ]